MLPPKIAELLSENMANRYLTVLSVENEKIKSNLSDIIDRRSVSES